MNRTTVILWSLLVLLLVNASVLAGCDMPILWGQSPSATVAVAPTPMISPTQLVVIPTTSPSATKMPSPEPFPTLTPSPSPTPRRLDLSGVIYLHFRPKTKYDEREYPYRGKLYQVDPNTGQTNPLLTGDVQGFATSPDGSQLAYTRRDAQGDRLLVRSLADSKDETLFAGSEEIQVPVWSPDGCALAYVLHPVSGDQLRVRNLVNGTDEVLFAGREQIGAPRWSPDGRELAFTQYMTDSWATSEVWVVGADDPSARKIADGFHPGWSPSSQQLAYVTQPRILPYAQNSLEIVDRSGKNRQIVFDTDPQTWQTGQRIEFSPQYGDPLLLYPHWSPDGGYLLFVVSAEPEGLYRIQLDTGVIIKLASAHLSPSIDGEFFDGSDRIVAVVSGSQGRVVLYTLAVTKQGEVSRSQISQDADIVTNVALSPDKRYVAYIATDQKRSRLTFVLYDLQASQELLRREIFENMEKPYFVGCDLEWAP